MIMINNLISKASSYVADTNAIVCGFDFFRSDNYASRPIS